MPINYSLLVQNIVSIFAFISTFGLGILVLLKDYKKTINIVFSLLNFSVAAFYISHLLGVNASSAAEAYNYFRFNWTNIAMVIFTSHLLFETIGKSNEHKFGIIMTYVTGFGMIAYFTFFPDAMIGVPVPKMYMPFYYTPGPFYTLMRIYVLLIPAYSAYYFFKYFLETKGGEHVRLKYVAAGLLFGYGVGTTSILPIYDVYFDPIISMLFGFYSLFLAYGIIEFESFNINVVGKRAVVYGSLVVVTSIILVLINTFNSYIMDRVPGFLIWVTPLISSCIAVAIGSVVWNRILEVDVAKREFITIVTHKFRTPLTSIKWSAEILDNPDSPEDEKRKSIDAISRSESVLSGLIETLVRAYKTDNDSYRYADEKTDIKQLLKEVVDSRQDIINTTNSKIVMDVDANLPELILDKERIKFVIQTLLDNAITYSPKNQVILVKLSTDSANVYCTIKDSGIGISKDELPHIFSKFFRGDAAKLADTEGLGVGLSLSKKIIERHGGDLSVKSEGAGRGSEFTIKLPIA